MPVGVNRLVPRRCTSFIFFVRGDTDGGSDGMSESGKESSVTTVKISFYAVRSAFGGWWHLGARDGQK